MLIGAAVLFFASAPDDRPEPVQPAPIAEQAIPPPPPAPTVSKPIAVEEVDGPNDVLGRAADYKAVFVKYRASRDPIERSLAGRAHRACFPLFMPPPGETPSTTHVMNALAPEHRAERRQAVETLFARCRSFLAPPMDMADVVATAESATNGDLATPGASVRWSLIRGDREKADAIAQRALASKEPYALQSLSGLSLMMMNERSVSKEPAATDAALALLACDLGAACGPDSLLALQLCATEGRCEGSARERMLARLGPLNQEAVETEHARLRMLFDAGAATVETVWRGGR